MRYYEKDNAMLFENPRKTAALMKYRIRLLEALSQDGNVPEAWSGCYADCHLKASSALIGAGEREEGYALLEKTFVLYEKWLKIPEGKNMDAGDRELFGEAKISKIDSGYVVNIFFADGSSVWMPDLCLFWQAESDIERAMSNWPWLDAVRSDERYKNLYAKAVAMAKSEKII